MSGTVGPRAGLLCLLCTLHITVGGEAQAYVGYSRPQGRLAFLLCKRGGAVPEEGMGGE